MEMFFGFVVGILVGLVAMNHLWQCKIRFIVSTGRYDLLSEDKVLDKK